MFNFDLAVDNFRTAIDFESSTDWISFYQLFTDSLSSFILSELNYRQAERATAAGIYSDKSAYYNSIGEKFNLRGISGLTDSVSFLSLFHDSEVFPITDPGFDAILAQFKLDLSELFIDLEIKSSDITQIITAIDNNIAAISQQSGNGLLSHMEDLVNDLIDVRGETLRGTEENIAIWKLLAVAALIGMAFWGVYACQWRTLGCTSRQRKLYACVMVVACLLYGAC